MLPLDENSRSDFIVFVMALLRQALGRDCKEGSLIVPRQMMWLGFEFDLPYLESIIVEQNDTLAYWATPLFCTARRGLTVCSWIDRFNMRKKSTINTLHLFQNTRMIFWCRNCLLELDFPWRWWMSLFYGLLLRFRYNVGYPCFVTCTNIA